MKKTRSKNIRLELNMLYLLLGIHALIAFVLTPIYSVLAADTIYASTLITDIVRTVIDVLDVAAMSVGFSIIAAAVFMGHRRIKFAAIYAGAVLFRRLGSIFTTLLVNHALEADEITMSISVFVLDIILLLICLIIVTIFSKHYRKKLAMSASDPLLFNANAVKTDTATLYPFKKIYSRGNPLQGCLLAIGVLLSAVKLILRTFALIIETPESVLMSVGGYVGDILIIIISYAVSCLILSWLYGRNEKRRALNKLYEN